jgi:hypothetical protein
MTLDEVLLDEDLLPVLARARTLQSCDAIARYMYVYIYILPAPRPVGRGRLYVHVYI